MTFCQQAVTKPKSKCSFICADKRPVGEAEILKTTLPIIWKTADMSFMLLYMLLYMLSSVCPSLCWKVVSSKSRANSSSSLPAAGSGWSFRAALRSD